MITDEQIVVALKEFNGPFGLTRIPGLHESEALKRLVRCWVDQLPAKLNECYGYETYQQLVNSGAKINFGELQRVWFDFFGIPVIYCGISHIRRAEEWRQHPDERVHFSGALLAELRDEELKPYGSDAIQALHLLRKAETLLGLPRDYYVQRHDRSSERSDWEWEADESGYIQYCKASRAAPISRPPVMEALNDLDLEPESRKSARETLVTVAEIWDRYDGDLKYMAKAGKQTFEAWAIRRLWGDISEIFEVTGSEFNIKKPWATIRDVLALCNVQVDTETVRHTLKPKVKKTSG